MSVGGDVTQSGKINQANMLASHIAGAGGNAEIDNKDVELTNDAADNGGVENTNNAEVGGALTQTGTIKQANVVANSIDTKGGGAEIDNAGAEFVNDAGEGIENNNIVAVVELILKTDHE